MIHSSIFFTFTSISLPRCFSFYFLNSPRLSQPQCYHYNLCHYHSLSELSQRFTWSISQQLLWQQQPPCFSCSHYMRTISWPWTWLGLAECNWAPCVFPFWDPDEGAAPLCGSLVPWPMAQLKGPRAMSCPLEASAWRWHTSCPSRFRWPKWVSWPSSMWLE